MPSLAIDPDLLLLLKTTSGSTITVINIDYLRITTVGLPQAPKRPGTLQGYKPIIAILQAVLATLPEKDALDQAVANALKKAPDPLHTLKITDAQKNTGGKQVYDVLCVLYFIFDQPPLVQYQTPIQPSSEGKQLTPLSAWILHFAESVGHWMDNPDSITQDSLQTFIDSPAYNSSEWWPPVDGPWITFNSFFARKLHDGLRPIAPGANVIVFPADSTFDAAFSVGSAGTINVKGLEWDISSLLQGSEYATEFAGGVWMHSFLNVFNYHRQHAPIGGKLLEARIIQGAAYLDVQPENGGLKHIRRMPRSFPTPHSTPSDEDDVVAEDGSGYQFLQSRAIFVIDAGPIGKVAVLPIGMAQVSAVKLSVAPTNPPTTIDKGSEISYFQFGGSDIVCVFQAQAGLKVSDFLHLQRDTWWPYGSAMVTANPGGA